MRLVFVVSAIATVFKLYLGSDMIFMMRRKPKPTLLLTQEIFNLQHDIGIKVIHSRQMDCSTTKCYGNDRIHTPVTNPVP